MAHDAPLAALLAALALAPAAADAHELWLERAGGEFVLRHGHRGGALLALDPARVTSIRCVEGGPPRALRALGAPGAPRELRVPGPCGALSASYDNGFWSLTPDGEVHRPRTEVRDAVRSWASRRFAKWVDVRSPAASRAVAGDPLELVLAQDGAGIRDGAPVTVRVLSEGAPVAGAAVTAGHERVGETDRAGEVRVRLRGAGTKLLGATLRRKLAAPEAEQLVLEATLTFEVTR